MTAPERARKGPLSAFTGGKRAENVIAAFVSVMHRRNPSEDGASLVEYALLLAFIAVVCIAAVAFFGGEVSDSFSRTGSQIP
jgi:Flp pilus assembly pilin Flp